MLDKKTLEQLSLIFPMLNKGKVFSNVFIISLYNYCLASFHQFSSTEGDWKTINTCACMYVHKCMHTHMHTHTHMCLCAHTGSPTHTRTHMHMHTHPTHPPHTPTPHTHPIIYTPSYTHHYYPAPSNPYSNAPCPHSHIHKPPPTNKGTITHTHAPCSLLLTPLTLLI